MPCVILIKIHEDIPKPTPDCLLWLQVYEEENECLKLQHSSTLESVKAIQSEYQSTHTDYQKLQSEHKTLKDEVDKLTVDKQTITEKYEVCMTKLLALAY